MRWACLLGNVVFTVVEQDTMPTTLGPWHDVTGLSVGAGDTFDGSSFTSYAATAAGQNEVIKDQIAALEGAVPRMMREYMVSQPNCPQYTIDLNNQLIALRARLV